MAYAATTAATVVTTTATAKKAPKVSATPAAAVPGPKKALDAAKSNLVSITEQQTRAISDVRAAKSAADQLRNTEVTAQKAAQQAKTSYLNANDRYVSMKNVKDKSTISTKSLTDQKYKVGTCEPLLCWIGTLLLVVFLVGPQNCIVRMNSWYVLMFVVSFVWNIHHHHF